MPFIKFNNAFRSTFAVTGEVIPNTSVTFSDALHYYVNKEEINVQSIIDKVNDFTKIIAFDIISSIVDSKGSLGLKILRRGNEFLGTSDDDVICDVFKMEYLDHYKSRYEPDNNPYLTIKDVNKMYQFMNDAYIDYSALVDSTDLIYYSNVNMENGLEYEVEHTFVYKISELMSLIKFEFGFDLVSGRVILEF